jgi:predicted small lipoprotein YifL
VKKIIGGAYMKKPVKSIYRFLAWFFSVIIAAGTLAGCGTKYGPPPTVKYGPPSSIISKDN